MSQGQILHKEEVKDVYVLLRCKICGCRKQLSQYVNDKTRYVKCTGCKSVEVYSI